MEAGGGHRIARDVGGYSNFFSVYLMTTFPRDLASER